MNRNEMKYADAQASIVELVTKHALGACKIPEEWKPIVTEIVSNHILILMNTLGNIELIYRRSMMHFKELEELELKKPGSPIHAFIDKPNLTPSGTATCEGELHQTPTVEKLSSGDHSIPIGPDRIDFP